MRRLAALAAALLVGAAAPLVVAPGPAGADPVAQCTLDRGTIVAVDFGHWGGPIVRGCGVDSGTGYQLLVDADFTLAGTQHDGPAFICRIGNPAWAHGVQYPTSSTEPCALTPPASAYWSYWLAPKGQHTWSYSQRGAMSDTPEQGEVQLWHFGATNIAGTCGSGVPPYSPDVLRPGGSGRAGGDGAACSSSKDRKQASSGRQTGSSAGGTHRGGAGGARHGGGSDAGGGSAGTGRGAGAPGRSSTAASGSSRPASSAAGSKTSSAARGAAASSGASSGASANPSGTTAGSGGPTIIDARPAAADTERPSTGSIAPVLLGVTLAVLLAGGAGWTVRRRRRASV